VKLGHLSKRRLQAWVDGSTDPRADAHLERCERCSGRVEALEPVPDTELRNLLTAELAPPSEMLARLEARVREEVGRTSELEVIGELFTLSLRTLRVLIGDNAAQSERGTADGTGASSREAP